MKITLLNENQNLDLAGDNVVLDFYADWCGPCKVFTRTLQNLSNDEHLKNVHVIKVDVEKHSKVAQQYNVRAMPTLVFLKGGEQVHTKVGAPSESSFKDLIEQLYGQ